jgi:tetratricopeptide (TPR) repeat protein
MRLPFILLFLLVFALTGCTAQKSAYVKDGKEYGVTSGLFRDRWWHYYERGLSFAEGGFYKEAIEDLKSAIERRRADQWRSRTYGMHIVDYFSHRELGIIYFKIKKFHEAEHELEASLRTAESAKAKYFLNKTRRAILKDSGVDNLPPVISINQPSAETITNRFHISLIGEAEDDYFVSSLAVNDDPILLELSSKKVLVEKEVSLKRGTNEIKIQATDLTGKTAEKLLKIEVDRAGPLIIIEDQKLIGRKIILAGYITDRSGIASFSINKKQIPILYTRNTVQDNASNAYRREMEFNQEIDLSEDADIIHLEVQDIAANVTKGKIKVGLGDHGTQHRNPENSMNNLPLFAAAFPADEGISPAQYAFMDSIKQIMDNAPPIIHLKDILDVQTVYTESLFLEGSVSDTSNIKSLLINGESVLIREGKKVFFNYLSGLREGVNKFLIETGDAFGNRSEKVITVKRVIPKIRKLGSRMTISVLPLKSKGINLIPGDVVNDSMITAFVNQKRFQMVERERIRQVLRELKLSQTDLVDPDTASKVGRIVVADAILTGTIYETKSSIEILSRLVDMETSNIMEAMDVFGEDKSLRGVNSLMEGLALKYKQSFPLLEGIVLKKEGKSVLIDLGSDKKIKKDMGVILYREGDEIRHPETGNVLGSEPEELGEAKVEYVYEGFSRAQIRKGKPARIEVRDKIITK